MAGRARKKPGDGVGKPAPSTLAFEEQSVVAREAALRLLTVRERSTVELRMRLRQKGFLPDVIEGVMEGLRVADLQSDERFAARFSEGAAARGLATRRIQGELRARGVGKELAAAAATESPEAERERALDVAGRRAARMMNLPVEARVRRLSGFLARRGYGPEICRSVAAEAAGQGGSEGEILDPDMGPDLP